MTLSARLPAGSVMTADANWGTLSPNHWDLTLWARMAKHASALDNLKVRSAARHEID